LFEYAEEGGNARKSGRKSRLVMETNWRQ